MEKVQSTSSLCDDHGVISWWNLQNSLHGGVFFGLSYCPGSLRLCDDDDDDDSNNKIYYSN